MKRTINTTTLHMKYYRFIAAADVVVVAVAAAAGVVCVCCCCCCSGPPLCWLTDETSPHLLPFFFGLQILHESSGAEGRPPVGAG